MEQPQLLGRQISRAKDHAGDAAAWPVEAGDQPGSYRIGASDEDDWHRGACDLARCRRRQTIGDDHGDLAANHNAMIDFLVLVQSVKSESGLR